METPGSQTPTLTWAVADVTEPITRPNAINPFRSTRFIFALSFGSPGSGQRLRHAHGIWHLFVLAGSAAHFIAILLYVV